MERRHRRYTSTCVDVFGWRTTRASVEQDRRRYISRKWSNKLFLKPKSLGTTVFLKEKYWDRFVFGVWHTPRMNTGHHLLMKKLMSNEDDWNEHELIIYCWHCITLPTSSCVSSGTTQTTKCHAHTVWMEFINACPWWELTHTWSVDSTTQNKYELYTWPYVSRGT